MKHCQNESGKLTVLIGSRTLFDELLGLPGEDVRPEHLCALWRWADSGSTARLGSPGQRRARSIVQIRGRAQCPLPQPGMTGGPCRPRRLFQLNDALLDGGTHNPCSPLLAPLASALSQPQPSQFPAAIPVTGATRAAISQVPRRLLLRLLLAQSPDVVVEVLVYCGLRYLC